MYLGIDIGGTTISLGLVDNTRLVYKETVPSFDEGMSLEETLEYLSSIISKVITPQVNKIGVGVPTVVDQQTGVLYEATNIACWHEVHLKEYLESKFGVEVKVNNDANCFALGAAALNNYPSSITAAITFGSGTGIGLVADGKLVSGENSGFGELAALYYNGKTYEDYCSKKFFTSKGLVPKDVYDAAIAEDAEAVSVMEEFGGHVGHLIVAVMLAYDPGCVILGGGIANSFSLFEKSMWKVIREEFPYPKAVEKLKIITSSEPDAALIGTALL